MSTEGIRKEMTGMVISDRMQKTVIVETRNHVVHPKYRKVFVRKAKFVAHDEKGNAKLGDVVKIRSCRPISKNKCWTLVEVIRRAKLRPEERAGRPARKGEKPVVAIEEAV
ncbi:MAG: 30S ribosomal protein S17 [Pseudomonadota bacterium]